MNRKTAKSSFVEKPFISVLGGIQPTILNNMSTEETKDNGFLDRLLLSFPEATIDEYNDNELDYSTIKWYSETILKLYETYKNIIERDSEGEIEPLTMKFSDEAKIEWKRIFNQITKHQNNEDENEYLKSMYPKQKSYIPRFALLIHSFDCFFDSNKMLLEVSKESILKAEKLSNYFVQTAKKIKYESNETQDLKTTTKKAETTIEKIKLIYQKDADFNRTKVAELLGVSRRHIINIVKKLEENV
jgi:hypothetical protein